MDRSFIIRALSLYVPIVACMALWSWRKPSRTEATGAVLATAWNVPTILMLNLLAIRLGWWHFDAKGALFQTIPVDLWLGWSALWGAFAVLLFRKTPLWKLATLFALFYVVAMPL